MRHEWPWRYSPPRPGQRLFAGLESAAVVLSGGHTCDSVEVQLGFKRIIQASACTMTNATAQHKSAAVMQLESPKVVIDAVTRYLVTLGADRLPEAFPASAPMRRIQYVKVAYTGRHGRQLLRVHIVTRAGSQKRDCRRRLSTLTCQHIDARTPHN